MVWKNALLIFCIAAEKVADLVDADLLCNTPALPCRLYDMAEAIIRESPTTLHMVLEGMMRYPYLRRSNTKPSG